MGSEFVLMLLAYAVLAVTIAGLVFGSVRVIPTILSDKRTLLATGASRARMIWVNQRLLVASLATLGLLLYLVTGIVILRTEPGTLRSALSRPLLFIAVTSLTVMLISEWRARKKLEDAIEPEESLKEVAEDTRESVNEIKTKMDDVEIQATADRDQATRDREERR